MAASAIVIIGGGPCGLTLARLLECKGMDYVVYERDENESFERAGGSLDIHPETGQQALKESGLFEKFKAFARYEDTSVTLADQLGKRLLQMGQGRDAPEIDRSELRKILLESIPKEKIKWGHNLVSASIGDDQRPVLRFANGVVISGLRLVVGADGAWSKVRKVLTQAIPKYSGRSFMEARISLENALYEDMAQTAGPGMFLSIGGGNTIITQRQGDGSYRSYFGIPVAEDFFGHVDLQNVEATRQLLLSDFYSSWSKEYKTLIRHVTDFYAWPLYTLSAEDMCWESVSGFTIMGDAAHLSVPNGEGVNLAMTDALNLATKIAHAEDLDHAVREFEEEMFPRGIATIEKGKRMAGFMEAEDRLAFFQRVTGGE